MLSDEWLSRYELLENLKIKLCCSVMGTRTTGVTAIALLVLRIGELKTNRSISDLAVKKIKFNQGSSFEQFDNAGIPNAVYHGSRSSAFWL